MRRIISCHKGLAPVSVPEEWLKEIDMSHAFAAKDGEGFIKFSPDKVYAVGVDYTTPGNPQPFARLLDEKEQEGIEWGTFCSPWEPYKIAQVFGHGKPIRLGSDIDD